MISFLGIYRTLDLDFDREQSLEHGRARFDRRSEVMTKTEKGGLRHRTKGASVHSSHGCLRSVLEIDGGRRSRDYQQGSDLDHLEVACYRGAIGFVEQYETVSVLDFGDARGI